MVVAPPAGTPLCKNGCGCRIPEGLQKNGRPYVTCCKACALNPGQGEHDEACPGPPPLKGSRPVCPKGARCRSRLPDHLAEQAHPLDQDYSACCAAAGVEAEPLSLKVLFDWTDADGSGRLSRQELQGTLGIIARLSGWTDEPEDYPPITDKAWAHLDEDGSGLVNFSEFAAWAGPRLGLPLGLRRAASSVTTAAPTCCSVLGCPCEAFVARPFSSTCATCKHKKHMHKSAEDLDQDVAFPPYWNNRSGNFQTLVPLGGISDVKEQDFQALFDRTYLKKWTRDRKRHSPDNPNVPAGYRVASVLRNENSQDWQEYYARRLELQTRLGEGRSIDVVDNVKTMAAWRDINAAVCGRLASECNEWYLFHGTSPDAAQAICSTDFKVACAGKNTGTLYGRGLYFAESITKADEYAKANEEGHFAVLLCRVLGGQVLYTDAVEPDPEELVYSCVEGPYDCVLGDREKCRSTFREFVLFDSEDVLPEYIVEYTRVYR